MQIVASAQKEAAWAIRQQQKPKISLIERYRNNARRRSQKIRVLRLCSLGANILARRATLNSRSFFLYTLRKNRARKIASRKSLSGTRVHKRLQRRTAPGKGSKKTNKGFIVGKKTGRIYMDKKL